MGYYRAGMDLETARWLGSAEAAEALAEAAAEADPGSLAAAQRLRRRWPADRAAAVLAQASQRRRAATKLPDPDQWLLTADGLEQATRPGVAAWRAQRFAATGVRRVVDLGCGLGVDARALADAGLEVVAVERDPVTAALAAANLRGRAEVVVGDAVKLWPSLAGAGTAVFCDPARRTSRGRSWRVEDLTPPWDFVAGLLDGQRPACLKLGPGVPHALLPDHAEVNWVSDRGDLVEASVWAGSGSDPGARRALRLPGREMVAAAARQSLPYPVPPAAGQILYEPDPAVIRAGAVPELADQLDARPLADHVAYLVADHHLVTVWATACHVLEVRDAGEKALRAWVRDHDIGILEIKKRGVDVDPAELRRRLRPAGRRAATLVLTPTLQGVRALVVTRIVAS